MLRKAALAAVIACVLPCGLRAAPDTREFLTAPRVARQIRLQFEAGRVLFDVDEEHLSRPLAPGTLFVARRDVALTVHRLNPLALQVTAGIETAEDPAHADLARLLKALLQIPAIVSPGAVDAKKAAAAFAGARGAGVAGGVCTPVQRAFDLLEQLHNALYSSEVSPETLARELSEWSAAIEAAPGPPGIETARSAIDAARKRLTPLISRAQRSIDDLVERLAADAPEHPDACAAVERGIYEMLRISNPSARLADVRAIASTIGAMSTALKRFDDPAKWIGDDYVVAPLHPAPDKQATVTVRAVSVTYAAGDGGIVITSEDERAATLRLRYFTPFAVEAGAGAVFAVVDRPKYGTRRNSRGDLTIASAGVTSLSVDPSVLLNFVCRCGGGTILEPMAQVGASTSKETPSLFVGGGLRLFVVGRGDVAVGGGLLLAWVRDLSTLAVGDVVSGTADIQKDLAFGRTPRAGHYFVIQYKW